MTVVELSLSRFFKRKYSSLYRAIGGYFASRKNKKNREEKRAEAKEKIKSFLLKSAIEDTGNTHTFAIDITGNITDLSLLTFFVKPFDRKIQRIGTYL